MSRINQKACLSIVLPNYNHADYLPMTLDSILEFQDRIREIVVCDDASTDDSWKILTEYASVHPLIRLIRNEKNLGAMENIRLLLKEASGEFVMVQAADDYWIPEGMGRILDVLCSRRYPEVSFYCGRNLYRIEAENYCYEIPADFPEGVSAPGSVARFRRRAPWGAAGMIAKTALYRDLFLPSRTTAPAESTSIIPAAAIGAASPVFAAFSAAAPLPLSALFWVSAA